MDNLEPQDEALSKAARMKMSRMMKAKGKIIARKRAISMKKKSSPEKIKKKAQKQARDILAKKILKDKSKADLSISGKEALEKLYNDSEKTYDVVLMDCMMPIMDGFEATREIRAKEADGKNSQKIIALTASALAEERDKCLKAGMDDFLPKPVTTEDLYNILQKHSQK